MKRILWALLLCLPALPAVAQEPRPLTEEAAAAMAAFYNQPTTTRLAGEARVAAESELLGDVAVLGGPLTVAGTVRGDVLVINGDLELEEGAAITGRAIVVGGAVRGETDGVAGAVVVYPEALRLRREDGRLVVLEPERESWISAGWATWFGRADLAVAVDGSYNRVEGLPVRFGPRLELGRSNPTVLDARLIYRTRSGLRIHPDEFGHDLRLEQYLGGHRAVRLGLGLHRTIDPIERNGVSDTENSLSTFILHRDYRDHYSRHGWRAYLALDLRARPLDLGVEYRSESHGAARARTPWSLLDNDEPWRPQPLVAEGDLQSLRGWLRWDTRNDRVDPSAGWLVEAEVEQGLEGDLRILGGEGVIVPGDSVVFASFGVGAEFTSVQLDVRRYLRLSPSTRLALRGFFSGSPDDGALPPQRQHVLGGEGTLPGYDRFAFDCGARDAVLVDSFFPYYGCDRSVLFQVEGRFALTGASGFSLGRALGLDFDLATTPELILFADAGRAWIEEESQGRRLELGPSSFRLDAGVGLGLGRLGLYLALPLEGGDGANFFVRLGPRL